MNCLVTICARGGSKGIPGKNIKLVAGKPLLWYTAQVAKEVAARYDGDIIVSTDSDEIKEVAATCGLKTDYTRPDYLANDTCGKPDAIRDALLYCEKTHGKRYDYVIDLDVTAPIRTVEDVCECVKRMEACQEALTIFSVNPCARNPYFNMVEERSDGFYGVVLGGKYKTRQSAPKVYDMNASIYVYRRQAIDCADPQAVTDRSLIYAMKHICFDLDEPSDYDYLEYLLTTGKVTIG